MTQALFLLNHLWQSTLVAGVAWLVCYALLRANHPRVRFGVWLAASLKFLIPFTVLVEAGRRLGVRRLVTPAQSREITDFVTTGGAGFAATPFRTFRGVQPAIEWESVVFGAIAIIWAVGAAIVMLRWLRSWWTIRQAARTATPADSFGGVPVLKSERLRDLQIEPGVFGFWRQSILLPEGMETRLGEEQMRAVLTHEWHHAQRRDNLTAALQMLVEAIFWFYPAVWMIGRKLMEERELACDQATLEQAPAEVYAEGILNVCKFYRTSPLTCVPGISGADLRARLESILKNQKPLELGAARRWALAVGLIAMVGGPSVMGLLTAQDIVTPPGNSFQGLATEANKKFDVSTIKLNNQQSSEWRLGPPGRGEIIIVNRPLRGIIVQSFRTQANMVFGGPEWITNTNYDIVGKGPNPNVGNPEVWEMMRSLLIDRFKLKYHIENREMAVFELTVVPKGHKLTPGEKGQCAQDIKDGKNCGDIIVPPFGAAMFNMPIGALITGIGRRAGRPIVDKTGLTGRYDSNITWLPDGARLEDLNLADVPPEFRPQDMTLFEALEKQGGLKLEPAKAPMPVLVIDSISEPDAN